MEAGERMAVVARRWPLVLVSVLVGLGLAAGVAVLTPVTYRAEARLFVSDGIDAPDARGRSTNGQALAGTRVRSYPVVATSADVLEPVARRLGLTAGDVVGRVVVSTPPGTQLIDVRAVDPTAAGAAALANGVGERLGGVIEALETPDGATVPPVRVRTVSPAEPPPAPLWPNVPVLLASGLVAGLMVGAGAALLLDRRRRDAPR